MKKAKEDWRSNHRVRAVVGFVRRHWASFAFLLCFGILTVLLINTRNLATKNDLSEQNMNAIAVQWQTQLAACHDSNTNLRRVINNNIVEPLRSVVEVAATPSGDPAFDVYVPRYRDALEQIKTVRLQRCNNRYPGPGEPSHGSLFRKVPLG